MTLDRRNFMAGTATVAGVAIMAPYLSGGSANATSSVSGSQNKGYYRTKVGAIEVTSLLDGGMSLGDSLMLNTSPSVLSKAKEENFIKSGTNFPAYVNAFVVNTGKKIVLVDTGARGMAETLGHVSENLIAAGYSIDMIDEVIITHAHPDHTNGLLDIDGGMMFPKAKIKISAKELGYWFDKQAMASAGDKRQMFEIAQRNLKPYQDKGHIETFQDNANLGGGLSAVDLPGHTPGHSGVRVSDGKEQLLIWGDIVHVPALQFAHPEASIAFDVDVEAARMTRSRIFDEVFSDKLRVAGMHLCFPAIGNLAKRGEGYNFIPQMWETAL